MKQILITMAALVVGCTMSFAQIRMGQRNGRSSESHPSLLEDGRVVTDEGKANGGGPGGRGGMGVDKSKDSVLTALKQETLTKFQQFTFEDAETGKTLTYNLCFPKDYDASKQYPMLMFIGDASTVGDPQRPLTQGYGALEFASDRDQTTHPSFVLVPSYSAVCVDDDFNTNDEVEMTIRLIQHLCKQYPIDQRRLYTTGQSMGGMMSFYFNIAHPHFFAASLFVGSQWDTSKMASFAGNKFFYIVGGGDTKASKGMADLAQVLKENNAQMDSASWSAKLPQDEQEKLVKQMLTSENNIHFISFTPGSVLAEEGKGMEHMESFDYAYKLQSVRDWLFEQTLDGQELCNPTIKSMMERRSIRKYLDKPVEHEKLQQIALCGINAPSGMNAQPWEIRIVEDPKFITELTEIYKKANPEHVKRDAGFKNMFRNAPNIICVATPKGRGQLDAGMLGENMMLAAQSLGLGTCCLGGPVRFLLSNENCKPYIDRLGFSEGYELLYILAVGYPDEQPAAKPRDAEKIKFIK
jgi:nitroreductase/predicted esterase